VVEKTKKRKGLTSGKPLQPAFKCAAVVDRERTLPAVRARFGYRRLHILLEREGFIVNHKRVHRILSRRGATGASSTSEAAHARGARPIADRESAA
jgi:hypothetical protein